MPVNGSPVGWYWTNSMSLSGAPARYARAMPSPVLMLAFVVNGKTFPQPPVHRITDLAATAWIRPVISSMATTPCTRPSSTSSLVTNHSSYRVSASYFSDVWNSACSMWNPVLSAANQVRIFFMPPNARTAMWPSGCRLQGQPQCSSWRSSRGASSTNASTASWSASQSLPEMVSWMCSSRVSPSAMTPAAPPSADTVWLRIGYTLDITATSSRGLVSAMAMAARRPAPPPPIRRTSCAAAKSPSLTAELLLEEDPPAVVHHHVVHAAVVKLLPHRAAPAFVARLFGDQPRVVLGHRAGPTFLSPARCACRFESCDDGRHSAPPRGSTLGDAPPTSQRGPSTAAWEDRPAVGCPPRAACRGLPAAGCLPARPDGDSGSSVGYLLAGVLAAPVADPEGV